MIDTQNFIHLHNHTEYSFLDGAIQIKNLVKRAQEWKMPALAITDHGGLFGAIEFHDTCKAHDIQPIIGFEAYISSGSRTQKSTGTNNRNNHLILLARNDRGFKNLMRLSSIGYIEGFYYKPRIDMEILSKYSEGLIAATACIAGAVPRAFIKGDDKKARQITEEYLKIFGENNVYFELQNHGIEEEETACRGMIELGKEMGIPFIVTNDAHYLNKEDAKAHEILLCMQTQDTLANPDHYRFSTDELYFKSPEEMCALFPEIPEAVQNTFEIARRCEVNVHHKPQLPVPQIPSQFKDADEYLRTLAINGLSKKYPDITKEVNDRMEYELQMITSMGFSGYFLIVRDFLMEADKMGIFRGCRGSAASSIVGYCIGMTNIDPIKFDLIFERFLNPERISMPDVDADIADNDRYRIIDYVVKKYGREAVCQIINFGRMKAKAAVKDVARVMGVPVSEANKLSAMIQEKTLEKSINASIDLKAAIDSNPQYKEVVQYAQILEGLARQPGMHAGGVIIAPSELTQWTPLFKQSKNDVIMTQFDMKYVESVGLIKMDILGLRTLTVLQEACSLIEKYHHKKIKLWEIDYEDEKTFKLFHTGETVDVFQFESPGMQDNLRKLKPTCIEDLIAMTSLYRPGPMKNIDSFIRRKHGKEKIEYAHPMLKEILNVTYGIIVYQEQVLRIAQKMGGFTLGQADILRKAMGKKLLEKMEEMKEKFLEGTEKQNINKKTAEEVYALITKFAEYGFNKAHAAVYAHISFQAAYLKAHYGKEYMTAVLTSHIGERDKFLSAKNEAQRMGLKVKSPDINSSDINCNIHGENICLGLSVISNVGKAAEIIINERIKKGLFRSIFDLCCRIDLRVVNKKTIESLIMAGAMDSLPGTRAQLFSAIEKAVEYGNNFQRDMECGQTNLFDNIRDEPSFNVPEPDLPEVSPWKYSELLAKEKEVLNFYMSGHPLDHYVDEINGFSTITLDEDNLNSQREGKSVLIGGMITNVKEITQKNGKQMAFLVLEDFQGSIELISFADTHEQFGHICAIDSMIFIRGKLQKRRGEQKYQIIIEKVIPLSESREKLTKSVHIKVNTQGLEEEFIQDIYSQCENNRGLCKLIIHLITQTGNQYKVLAKKISINPAIDVVNNLRKKLGNENVWLSQKAG
ncbi:MAG: DNA polymerase III subunit alpha [Chitinispirillia bacterium]|jgi:DNA polymerase-3 subunit alpha